MGMAICRSGAEAGLPDGTGIDAVADTITLPLKDDG
jgi:hypothetical protein